MSMYTTLSRWLHIYSVFHLWNVLYNQTGYNLKKGENLYVAADVFYEIKTVLGNHDYMGDAIAQFSRDLVNRDSRWYCKRDYDVHHSLCWNNKSKPLDDSFSFLHQLLTVSYVGFVVYNRTMQIICGFLLHWYNHFRWWILGSKSRACVWLERISSSRKSVEVTAGCEGSRKTYFRIYIMVISYLGRVTMIYNAHFVQIFSFLKMVIWVDSSSKIGKIEGHMEGCGWSPYYSKRRSSWGH